MPISPIQAQYLERDQKKKTAQYYQPNTKDKELIDYVSNQFTASEDSKKGRVRDAWINMAFYAGRQWVKWNDVSGRIEEISRDDWQVHLVLNYIRPVIQQLVGKATENQPTVVVLPATSDSDDRQKARASEKLISKYLWRELDMQLKVQEFARLIFQTGMAAFKVYWDPEGGEGFELQDPWTEDEQKIIKEFADYGMEHDLEPRMRSGKTGEIMVDVVSLFEIGWDPGAGSFEKTRWCYHSNSMHIDEVRSRWKKGVHVRPDSSFEGDQLAAKVLHSASHGKHNYQRNSVLADRVAVVEYFERPSQRYPKGMYAIVANGVLLESQEELPHGDLPFVVARHLPIHGRIDGDGAIMDLIAAQEEINKKVSQRIENANQMLNQKWLVVKGSLVNDMITDQPGEIIEYDAQYPAPRPIAPPPMPSDIGRLQDEMLVHMRNISGVSEIQQGNVPSGISGRAIGMMADSQATIMGPTVREIEKALEKLCMRFLKYWRDYMPVPKTIRIVGKDASAEVFTFHATDIKSTDVIIQRNSMLPKHVSYRREQAMMAFSQGAFGNPQDPAAQMRLRKLLEWGELDELYGDNDKDRLYTRDVLFHITEGKQQVNPEPWEDHAAAIDEFHDFMTSTDYRLQSDETKEEIKRNFAWHYYYQSQLQQAVPWWQMPKSEGWPPATPPQSAQPGQPGAPPIPPEQVFGPEPGTAPAADMGAVPPAGDGMTPGDLQAILAQAQQFGGGAPHGGMPEMNATPHGPGIGAGELSGLTREPM